jgi:hypothetical protein
MAYFPSRAMTRIAPETNHRRERSDGGMEEEQGVMAQPERMAIAVGEIWRQRHECRSLLPTRSDQCGELLPLAQESGASVLVQEPGHSAEQPQREQQQEELVLK